MARVVYCNIKDGHFKVWGFDCFTDEQEKDKAGECRVISYWGRIGLMMHRLQKKEKVFPNVPDAYSFIMNKIEEKKWKGYFTVPNHLYFGAIIDGSLSKLGKLLDKYQAKQS